MGTDSDLSTDLRLCGLNFQEIINGGVDCSVSQRFGQPYAVNCGKLLETGGIGAGMPRESMIHLSLRHKLRQNLLPPLGLITDTNCGSFTEIPWIREFIGDPLRLSFVRLLLRVYLFAHLLGCLIQALVLVEDVDDGGRDTVSRYVTAVQFSMGMMFSGSLAVGDTTG